ncbi:MAG: hypothetical protein ABW185_28030 [Sedimenticola sp.]
MHCRLALQELSSASYFEGGEGNKFFAHSLKNLENGVYRALGNLVALSIVHDGPGLHILHPAVAKMMFGVEAPLDVDDDHLPNPEVKDILRQVNSFIR